MPESTPDTRAESGKETLLAIGVSPSMAGWGRLEEARNLALRLIDEEEGELGLVAFGQNILAEWKPGTGKKELTEAVEGLSHDWKKGMPKPCLIALPVCFHLPQPRKNW